MKAGSASRDITPADSVTMITGIESTGVHDPLYARAFVLDDGNNAVAIVSMDITITTFDFTDKTRARVRDLTGIEHLLINTTHTHSAPRMEGKELEDLVVEAMVEAYENRLTVTLFAGRAPVQIGYNRRITDPDGQVSMGINKAGVVVPWVNVLVARKRDGDTNATPPLAVLFEHAAHPVIVHETSSLLSGDFCGHAVSRVRDALGSDTAAMFLQGCGANVNAHPLASGHANAEAAGAKLGDAVLAAVGSATEIGADTLVVRSKTIMLDCQPLPSLEVLDATQKMLDIDYANGTESGKPVSWVTDDVYRETTAKLDARKELVKRGEGSIPRRYGASVIKLGAEWCLVALEGETFCEYERWVDEASPCENTMTLGYTNGDSGYIATDAALALGAKGGYEAGTYPCWWAHGPTSESRNTPVVGTEQSIRNCVESLWSE